MGKALAPLVLPFIVLRCCFHRKSSNSSWFCHFSVFVHCSGRFFEDPEVKLGFYYLCTNGGSGDGGVIAGGECLHGEAGRAGGALRRDGGVHGESDKRRGGGGAHSGGAEPAICSLQKRDRCPQGLLEDYLLHRAEGG